MNLNHNIRDCLLMKCHSMEISIVFAQKLSFPAPIIHPYTSCRGVSSIPLPCPAGHSASAAGESWKYKIQQWRLAPGPALGRMHYLGNNLLSSIKQYRVKTTHHFTYHHFTITSPSLPVFVCLFMLCYRAPLI